MYSEVSTLEERVLTALLWGTAGTLPGAAEAAGCSRPVPCRSTPPESSITTTQAAASQGRGARHARFAPDRHCAELAVDARNHPLVDVEVPQVLIRNFLELLQASSFNLPFKAVPSRVRARIRRVRTVTSGIFKTFAISPVGMS